MNAKIEWDSRDPKPALVPVNIRNDQYETLGRLAEEKQVSSAWIALDDADKFVSER